MKKVIVIGSMNADLMLQVDRLPKSGETMIGNSFHIYAGGKGMNQAVCAAKLGASVTFLGCLGNDDYAKLLKDQLVKNNISPNHILIDKNQTTGTAFVTSSNEDNSIIVIPGANMSVDTNYVSRMKDLIWEADMVLLQFEIPIKTVYYVIDICYKKKIPVILNPAPAVKIDEKYIEKVSYLIPNETELELIFNQPYTKVLPKYPNKIIMSAGGEGAYYHDGTKLVHCEAMKTKVVDTTGAGDAFNGAFAVAILEGKNMLEAVQFANKIASITIMTKGAQNAMPDRNKL